MTTCANEMKTSDKGNKVTKCDLRTVKYVGKYYGVDIHTWQNFMHQLPKHAQHSL